MRTMGGRPVLLQRFPEGAGGPSFFQKRVPKSVPDWLQTTTVSTPNGTPSNALVVADVAHVLWAVNLGCLGFHVWPYLADDPEHTDELRIDLDPTPGIEFPDIREAALRAQDAARRARHRRLPEDHRQPRHPRVRPRRAGLGLLRRAASRGRGRARARAAAARPRHRGVVEGGARHARLHRLQPERAAQDGVRRVVGAGPAGRAGVDAAARGRRSTTIHPDELTIAYACRRGWRPWATRGRR